MLNSWHNVFAQALKPKRMVGVYQTIAKHVGREPTRSELSAGRRAAHRMAENGEAVIVKVVAAPAPGRSPVQLMVLARPDADVSDPDAVAEAANGLRRSGYPSGPAADPAKVVPGLVNTLHATAATARLLDVSRIAPTEASSMEAALTKPLEELSKLRNRLRRRARIP